MQNHKRKKNVKIKVKKNSFSFKGFWRAVKLSILVSICLTALGFSLYFGSNILRQFLAKPIEHVVIEGQFQFLDKAVLADEIKSHLQGSFIRESLVAMQRKIVANPWIDSVTLRRQWPNRLYILITEQRPIAQWKDVGFINYRGELVVVDDDHYLRGLPVLKGDDEKALEIMQQYQVLSDIVAQYDLGIAQLYEDDLGVWRFSLSNGWQFLAGRSDVAKKLQRVMRILSENKIRRQEEIAVVDMRYVNGLAIQWKQVEQHARNINEHENKTEHQI